MYAIRFSLGVEKELRRLRAYDRVTLLDEIEHQLSAQPKTTTKRRKSLENLSVPEAWNSIPPIWQLKVGNFRVFYDVDSERQQVVIRAIRKKPPHITTEEIL